MTIDSIIASIDSEIKRLQQAHALLSSIGKGKAKAASAPRKAGKKRILSAAARKRIGDAQRKRWAKEKAAKKAA